MGPIGSFLVFKVLLGGSSVDIEIYMYVSNFYHETIYFLCKVKHLGWVLKWYSQYKK